MKTPVIELHDVVKTHKLGEQDVQALRKVTLQIFAGTYNMLLGPSGCGKSTLLSLVAGLDTPTSGKILLRGEDISELSVDQLAYHRRKRIGMVFQQFNLLRSLAVWENVALPYVFDGQAVDVRKKRAFELLELVRMQDFGYRLPTQLSGGQQQKVAIVRALMNNPWILLVDEPTGNLDSVSAQEVMDFLQVLNKKSKRTILLVTHNYEYVRYAERVIYMRDGVILTPQASHQTETKYKELQQETQERDKGRIGVGFTVARDDKKQQEKEQPEEPRSQGETLRSGASRKKKTEVSGEEFAKLVKQTTREVLEERGRR